jgi:hypothetical protein
MQLLCDRFKIAAELLQGIASDPQHYQHAIAA